MKFISLKITYKDITRYFRFDEPVTLIHSNTNSVGKSTLLRLLFYSLGYAIPGTKNIRFSNVVTEVVILNSNEDEIKILRKDDEIFILNEKYFLPEQFNEVLELIWETSNIDILNNVLGAIYLDQEKGWTLLNRGIVIGNIRFSLEQLIGGLDDRNWKDVEFEITAIKKELNKYQQMKSIYEYQQSVSKETTYIEAEDYIDKIYEEVNVLRFEENELSKQIDKINEIRINNKRFLKYVEDMKLLVETEDKSISIPVNSKTIVGFKDNQNYVIARKRILENQLRDIVNKKKKLEKELLLESEHMNIQSEIQKFDNEISKIIVNPTQLDNIISDLTRQLKEKKSYRELKIKNGNTVIDSLHNTILSYAKELNVDEYINANNDYIFTSDLKSLSGAILHKLVFIFKIAYIIEIEKVIDIKLPIVLDSPSGREVDQKNIKDIMIILNRDFQDNQIIIASIFDNYVFDNMNRIILKKRLFE